MGAPQIIMIILMTLNVTVNILQHGKTTTKNGVTTLFLDLPLTVGLLYWGGFFS